MKFGKKGLFPATLLFAGLLIVPAVAQQEVSPDHFEDHPAVAQGKKPAVPKHQTAASRSHRTGSSVSAQAKSKTVVDNTVLKADAGKGEPVQSPR
jgi:hypothetical protein